MRCIRLAMILYSTDSLFAWNRLDDSPDLRTIREFFAILPDGRLLDALQTHRGRGRNDRPIRALWFCAVLQRLLRHPTMRLTLDELRRNTDLPAPDGGHKEYTDDEGRLTEVLEWFGYKLHLLCDARHEVALAYRITPASKADNKHLAPLVEEAEAKLYCYDMVHDPPVCHRMAYIGHERSRGTLKYRCPAAHESWLCPSSKRCNKAKRYGMTVRVKQELDLRRFPPIPRATKKFERLYKGRTAVERVNARMKIFWGVDDGNVAGGASFHANVGVVMLVHIGLATLLAKAPRRDPKRRLGQTRLSPVAKALHGSSRR